MTVVSPSQSFESAVTRRKLLSIVEAAEYLSTSVRFVRDRRADGQVPAVKLGGLLRFDPEDLDQYIEASREVPTLGSGSGSSPAQ